MEEALKPPRQVRDDLLGMLEAGLRAVAGDRVVESWLRANPQPGDFALVAVGKAAIAMAAGAEAAAGDRIARRLVITAASYARGASSWVEGAHPVADGRSLDAGRTLIRFLDALPAEMPLMLCLSGGASAMVEVLRPGIDASFLAEANDWLLGSGLAIAEVNAVRKALSCIKGGGLRDFIGRREVRVLLISDVPDDDPAVIGSGPLMPDEAVAETLARMTLPPWLDSRIREFRPPGAGLWVPHHILATNSDARCAVATEAKRRGFAVVMHDDLVQGDAAVAGAALAAGLLEGPAGIQVWGGETTVRLPDDPGRGGRNQHLALAAAVALAGRDDVALLSVGSDGRDGPGEDAGALVDGGTVARGRTEGLDPYRALAGADSGTFLEVSGDLLNTGETDTNVMDLMIGWKGDGS